MHRLKVQEDIDREQKKFMCLYEAYRNIVYQCAMWVLHDTYLAEDAVQEVFLKFVRLEVLDKIKEIESPKTKAYVYVLTKNVVYNMFNKRKRSSMMFSQEDLDALAHMCMTEDILEQVLNKYNMKEVENIIQKLPPNYVDILELKYFEQLSDKELAAKLDIKEATARKRLERARKLFRDRYFEDAYDDEMS